MNHRGHMVTSPTAAIKGIPANQGNQSNEDGSCGSCVVTPPTEPDLLGLPSSTPISVHPLGPALERRLTRAGRPPRSTIEEPVVQGGISGLLTNYMHRFQRDEA